MPKAATNRDFSGLPLLAGGAVGCGRQRVCIVTPELPEAAGETAMAVFLQRLSFALAGRGHAVTVLYVGTGRRRLGAVRRARDAYRHKGVDLQSLDPARGPFLHGTVPAKAPLHVYRWLRSRPEPFNVIHFPERSGLCYYAVLAKTQGLAFADTILAVHATGPTLWHQAARHEYVQSVDDLILDFMERESLRRADLAISPTRYIFNWMLAHDWELPGKRFVQPWLLSDQVAPTMVATDEPAPAKINEIVFYGRLESQTGLGLFCDAINRSRLRINPAIQITFLGPIGIVNNRHPRGFISGKAAGWKCRWRIVMGVVGSRAREFLRQPGRLAVLASPMENFSQQIATLLADKVLLLVAGDGGASELIAPSNRQRICFPQHPGKLAAILDNAVEEGMRPVLPAIDIASNIATWTGWHNSLEPQQFSVTLRQRSLESPLVSICIPHFNAFPHIKQTLDSVRKQEYPNIEVVLVDDGSTDSAAIEYLRSIETEFKQRGWKIIYQDNRYQGAARNTAATNAAGQYLLFLDSDDVLFSGAVAMLVDVAVRTGADLVCGASVDFSSPEPPEFGAETPGFWAAIGPAAAAGAFVNIFGPACLLVKAASFVAVAGYKEIYGAGSEDWELYSRSTLAGLHHEFVPEPVYWYRISPGSMIRSTNRYFNEQVAIRPYLDAVPASLQNLILLTQGISRRASLAIKLRRSLLIGLDLHVKLAWLRRFLHSLRVCR